MIILNPTFIPDITQIMTLAIPGQSILAFQFCRIITLKLILLYFYASSFFSCGGQDSGVQLHEIVFCFNDECMTSCMSNLMTILAAACVFSSITSICMHA